MPATRPATTGDHPLRWLLIQAGQYVEREGIHYSVMPEHVIAFSTDPGEGCEQANFGLCLYPGVLNIQDPRTGLARRLRTELTGWCWSSFCKTRVCFEPAAGGVENFLRCHLCVIRMLDHAKQLGILADVSDEGDFWEKRDVKALAKEVGEWNEDMAGLVGQLKDMFGGDFEAPIAEFPDFEHLEARGRRKKRSESFTNRIGITKGKPMWLFTKHGHLEHRAAPVRPRYLVVHAQMREEMDSFVALLDEIGGQKHEVQETTEGDYHFLVMAKRAVVAEAVAGWSPPSTTASSSTASTSISAAAGIPAVAEPHGLASRHGEGVRCRMKPFHEMTKREAVEHLRSLYHAQPKADWDSLAVGNVILHKG